MIPTSVILNQLPKTEGVKIGVFEDNILISLEKLQARQPIGQVHLQHVQVIKDGVSILSEFSSKFMATGA